MADISLRRVCRSLLLVSLTGVYVAAAVWPCAAQSISRAFSPMAFKWAQEGPPEECGQHCRKWIAADGLLVPETPQRFSDFAKAHDIQASTIVLNSPGGEINAAIWLGRELRRLGIAATVGKTIEIPGSGGSYYKIVDDA